MHLDNGGPHIGKLTALREGNKRRVIEGVSEGNRRTGLGGGWRKRRKEENYECWTCRMMNVLQVV